VPECVVELGEAIGRTARRAGQDMSIEAREILGATVVGVGATLMMDGWNLFLERVFRIPSLDYRLLGRWVLHMPEGTFRHSSIRSASPKPFERTIGWMAHYSIGVGLALGFVVLTSGQAIARPALLPALVYGIGTVVFPFFVLQPSLGLGFAPSRAPDPTRVRAKSLMTHTVFGVGLYVCSLCLSALLGALG